MTETRISPAARIRDSSTNPNPNLTLALALTIPGVAIQIEKLEDFKRIILDYVQMQIEYHQKVGRSSLSHVLCLCYASPLSLVV
jgi:hypothetical protein